MTAVVQSIARTVAVPVVGHDAYDYYIDAVNGSDSNDGLSSTAAWAGLEAKLTTDILVAGKTTRVKVKAGTYTDQALLIINATSTKPGAILEIFCEPGVVIDWTLGTDKSCVDVQASQGYEWTCRIYGNGLRITGFNAGTGNGLGGATYGILHAYNVTVDNCVDGVSAHGSSKIYCYDCTFHSNSKSAFAHIDTTQTYHYRCSFTEVAAGGVIGIGSLGVNVAGAYFEDCDFIPDAVSGSLLNLNNGTVVRSRLGDLTHAVHLNSTVKPTITDSFVNAYIDGSFTAALTRCYGKFTTRVRNGGDIDVLNCVFSGPATGQTVTVLSNFNPGSGSKLVMNDNIFAGSWTFMSVDATNAGYLVAAASEFKNNILYPSLVYDADLVSADTGGTVIVGTITSDPLIGDADTLVQADYAFGAGSPAIGAGTTGDIGF